MEEENSGKCLLLFSTFPQESWKMKVVGGQSMANWSTYITGLTTSNAMKSTFMMALLGGLD